MDMMSDKKIPWDVYPRKQFERSSYKTLNGIWKYQITEGERPVDDRLWKKIGRAHV